MSELNILKIVHTVYKSEFNIEKNDCFKRKLLIHVQVFIFSVRIVFFVPSRLLFIFLELWPRILSITMVLFAVVLVSFSIVSIMWVLPVVFVIFLMVFVVFVLAAIFVLFTVTAWLILRLVVVCMSPKITGVYIFTLNIFLETRNLRSFLVGKNANILIHTML